MNTTLHTLKQKETIQSQLGGGWSSHQKTENKRYRTTNPQRVDSPQSMARAPQGTVCGLWAISRSTPPSPRGTFYETEHTLNQSNGRCALKNGQIHNLQTTLCHKSTRFPTPWPLISVTNTFSLCRRCLLGLDAFEWLTIDG